jgi:hypothetical protein
LPVGFFSASRSSIACSPRRANAGSRRCGRLRRPLGLDVGEIVADARYDQWMRIHGVD